MGYAEGTAKAVEDAVRDREAVAARLEKDVQDYLEKADMAREEMISRLAAALASARRRSASSRACFRMSSAWSWAPSSALLVLSATWRRGTRLSS